MGNSGRQAETGKRLASLQQQIPSEGASNVQTARTDNSRAGEAKEDAKSPEIPGAFTLRYLTPKRRRATPAQDEVEKFSASPQSTALVTPPSRDTLPRTAGALDDNGSWQHRSSRSGWWGQDELYDSGGDQGEPLEDNNAAMAEGNCFTPQASDDEEADDHREQTQKDLEPEPVRVKYRARAVEHTTGARSLLHLQSRATAARGNVLDGSSDLATESVTHPIRVRRSIRLRKRSADPEHTWASQESGPPNTLLSNGSISRGPHAQADQTEGPAWVEGDMPRNQRPSEVKTCVKDAGTLISRAAREASPVSRNTSVSGLRAPTLSFKPRKLRGIFDASALEKQFGIKLSSEAEQRLRVLSGNDMGSAINIYLQGYCKDSDNQALEVSNQKRKAVPGLGDRRSGSESMSSIRFWQQMRQSEIERRDSHSEMTKGIPGREAMLSENWNVIGEESNLADAERTSETDDLLFEGISTPGADEEPDVTKPYSRPLLQHVPSPEEVTTETLDWQAHSHENSISTRQCAATADKDNLIHAIGVVKNRSPEMTEANDEGEFPGTGPVPLRGMQGFTNQENVRPRNPPSGTSRLTNGKLGSGSGWGAFGMPMAGAPGLQTMQQRNMAGNSGMGSFAQNIGGSQPATPLDPSEFPSLSATPQTQQQNPGPAIWAQRPSQPNPTSNQRQQQSQASQPNPLQEQQQSQSAHEDMFSAASHFSTGLGDYGQSSQQGAGRNQPQTGSIDEFPPLGRESSLGQGQERGGSLMQNNAFGGYGAGMAFAGMTQQQRSLLTNALDRERMASPASSGMGLISSSRSPISQGQNGSAGQEKLGTIGSGAEPLNRQGDFSTSSQQQQPHQSSQMMNNNTFGGNDIVDSPSSIQQQTGPPALEHMSDADKFGLPGLLAMMHHPSADLRSLTAQGQDLTTLGLDLTSPEPLHTQLASVFNPHSHTRLPLDADYTLPACYRVANVQALHERIPSFSEETLFYIFYSSPKDLVQELVADELIGRKWRFHKGEKMWVTRDENYPAPVEVEREISEQGFYIWWDWKGWKKVRRQYILRYEDLDNGATRNGSALNQMALSAAPSSIAQAAGVFSR